eukprot:TRINITY_DN66427_c7_g7_i1.p1 TRINITY_DN66427_c7_g7~~TRINITY_DN66427_c7_g7_i1.p1  ORF type:complete len:340 (-),score=45.09 TRINITY_DN66427_c7_g7_i1:140-1159(-)
MLLWVFVFAPLVLCAPEDFTLLFAISGSGAKPPRTFETISPTTGKPVQIGQEFKETFDAQGLSSIDDRRGIYYFIGRNLTAHDIHLIGVSTDTGNVLSQTPLPFLRESFIGVGEYVNTNSETGHCYCTGRSDDGSETHELWDVDPFTHKKKLIANVGDKSKIEVLGGLAVYDPSFGVEWVQLARNDTGRLFVRFYGYDVKTGFLVNIIDDEYNMATMAYDQNTQRIFGIGGTREQGKIVLRLVRFDSETGQFHVIGDIPGYHGFMGSEFTINHRARKAYGFMTKFQGANSRHVYRRGEKMPAAQMSFDLVTISLDTGKVLHTVEYCSEIFACPWSFQYQ